MEHAMNATVICDHNDERALLAFMLQRAGVTVAAAAQLEGGMRDFVMNPSDLILLALRQPAIEVQINRVRRDSEVCLVVIADDLAEDAQCQALDAGADLVVTRPYGSRWLISQIMALLRRTRGTSLSILPTFTLGKLTLDPSTRTVTVVGHASRRLTQLEFRLLYVLMLHRGQTLPTEIIVERVWGYDGKADTELVRGLVRRLRTKIEPDPQHPRYLITIPALGYRLEVPEEE
jgi:DNA-binding response OmpR family regulator